MKWSLKIITFSGLLFAGPLLTAAEVPQGARVLDSQVVLSLSSDNLTPYADATDRGNAFFGENLHIFPYRRTNAIFRNWVVGFDPSHSSSSIRDIPQSVMVSSIDFTRHARRDASGPVPESTLVWGPFDPGTMFIQVGGGVLGAGLVGVVTVPLSILASGGFQTREGIGTAIGLAVGGGLAVTVGFPLGVYFTGKWMGGTGKHLPTLIGTLIGAGIGIAISASAGTPLVTIPVLPTLTIIGGLLGYHLSASPVYRGAPSSDGSW